MNPEIRDLLLRIRVLLAEDVEDFGIHAARHKACIEEIDRLLAETKPVV